MPEPGVSIFSPPKAPATSAAPAAVERNTAPVQSATSTTVQSSPDITPAQQLWAADQRALEKMDPWRDPNITMVKDPVTGVITAKQRTDGGQNGVPQPDAGGQQPQPGQAAAVDGKLHVGDLELTEADVRGLMERKAAEDSRRATMPRDAAGYSLDLPEGFVLPPDVSEWAWNLEDPNSAALLGQAKEWAFAHQIDGPAFSKLLGLYASNQIADQQRFDQARKAEVTKLGPNISVRVDSVNTWLEAQVGSTLAHALRQTMVTARSVEAYEKLMRSFITQGVGGSPGAGRDGAGSQPARMSDADYNSLSYHEKLSYAQKFQAQSNGSPRK
jgi:hypothetical protein